MCLPLYGPTRWRYRVAMFGNVKSWREKGMAQAHAGRWDACVAPLQKVLAKEPHDLQARQRLAEALARLGRQDEAVAQYAAVAESYARDGFLLKAMAVCRHLLQLQPAHTATQELLAQLGTRKKDASAPDVPVLAPPEDDSAPLELSSDDLELLPDAPDAASLDDSEPLELSSDAVELVPDVPPPLPRNTPALDPKLIPAVPLFSELSPSAFVDVLSSMTLRVVRAGETLLREGEPGDSMFIVVQGAMRVERPSRLGGMETLVTLRAGTFVGEMALWTRAPRLATVTAAQPGVLLELTRGALEALAPRHPSLPKMLERFYKTRLLHNVLRASPLFRPLDGKTQAALLEACQLVVVERGTDIIRQGQGAQGLFVLLRGHATASARTADGDTQKFPDLKEGDVFGEIALFMGTQSTATVRSVGTCQLLKLPADAFETLVRPNPEVARALASLGEQRLRRMGLDMEIDVGTA